MTEYLRFSVLYLTWEVAVSRDP